MSASRFVLPARIRGQLVGVFLVLVEALVPRVATITRGWSNRIGPFFIAGRLSFSVTALILQNTSAGAQNARFSASRSIRRIRQQ